MFDASGLAAGEDLEFVALYAPDSQSSPDAFDAFQDRWPRSGGSGASCYSVTFGADQGDGYYSMVVLAGPYLRPVSKRVVVLKGSASG